jgi:hypothetical protein
MGMVGAVEERPRKGPRAFVVFLVLRVSARAHGRYCRIISRGIEIPLRREQVSENDSLIFD